MAEIKPKPFALDRRHLAALLLSIGLSVALLLLICWLEGIDLKAVVRQWRRADKTILTWTILCSSAFHIFVGADKMWRVLRAMGVDISYREMALVRLGSGPLRVLMPFKTGELVNMVFFWRHKQMPFARASGAVVFDKGLNFIGILFWLLVGVCFLSGATSFGRVLAVGCVGGGYLLFFFCAPLQDFCLRLVSRAPKLASFAQGALSPFREFSVGRKLFFLVYGLAFQLRPLAVCYFLLRAYGVEAVGVADVFARASIAILAGHVPGVFVGIGPREEAIVLAFHDLASKDVLLSVGLLMTFAVHLAPMLLGAPFVPWFLRKLRIGFEEGIS